LSEAKTANGAASLERDGQILGRDGRPVLTLGRDDDGNDQKHEDRDRPDSQVALRGRALAITVATIPPEVPADCSCEA
jgi:hypothetical protein